MKKTLFKLNKRIVSQGVSLVAVFAVLVVTLVAFVPNLTFGWFSQNTTVTATGMAAKASQTPFEVHYRVTGINGKAQSGDWKLIDLSSSLPIADSISAPGDYVDFQIKITNLSLNQVNLKSFGFAAPTIAEEIAKTVDSNSYYLSTEIGVKLISVGTGATLKSDVSDIVLRESASVAATEIDLFEHLTTESISVASNGEFIFGVRLTFINDPDNSQDVFKKFGTATDGSLGRCERRLFFTFDEVH